VQLLRDQVNPSYLVVDPARRFLFATHSDTELVSAFRIDSGTGQVTPLNQQSTGGRNPAHLALDPTGRFLLIANYAGGSVAVVPVLSDGSLGPRTDLVQVRGDLGPHRTEQATAHPHQCRFDRAGHFVAVPDKGLDRVFVFRLDPAAGTLRAAEPPSVATRSGAGPRHIDFHPTAPFAYVINELDSSVTSYRVDPERETLSPFQIVSSLPPSFVGNSTGAAIVVSPSGRSLYASNRGHDSLAVFAVSGNDGTLSPVGWVPSGGRTPRFFCLDPAGTTLYAANQATDTIVALRIDEATGMPAATGQVIATGTPTAIAFATLD
jgi:6-phosphogluconolactonase (cycloisomerase 2 family)